MLRSSLREFLCSEAMHWLGVPTTRALSLVATGEPVVRDMFYDGNPREEPGAVVCRVAPSFLRFGNFEILAAQGEHDELRQVDGFRIARTFSRIRTQRRRRAFDELCRRTALLMADWMRLGFVHGVMNTDNMSILGLTIDYGPYGWLEGYDLAWTPNTTDAEGRRYCYGNQPQIAQWNLARLAEALLPLVPDKAQLAQGLELYASTFADAWRKALAQQARRRRARPAGRRSAGERTVRAAAGRRDRLHDLLPQPGDADGGIRSPGVLRGFAIGFTRDLVEEVPTENRK